MNLETPNRERESILSGLADGDDELRRLSVERLLLLPLPDALPHLIASLGDSCWRVRKAGVERLVACGEVGTIASALIDTLADGENPGRRNSAVEALVRLGTCVVSALIDGLSMDDVDVRKFLVDALAGIGDASARGAMIATLEDPDPNIRAAAADALGAIGGDEVLEPLAARATDEAEDTLVRLSALQALVHLDAMLDVDALGRVLGDPSLAAAGYRLLGNHVEPQAVDALLKGMAQRGRGAREAVIDALLRVLSRCDGADASDLEARIREAAQAQSELIAMAIDRLRDADLAVRLSLVQFLGLVGTPAVVLPILEAGRDEAIEAVALGTLLRLGESSVAAVDRDWDQLDNELRTEACSLLGHVGGRRATLRLLEALDAHDVSQRVAAARALAMCGDHDVLAALLRRLDAAALCDEFEAEEETGVLVDAVVEICLAPDRGGEALVADAVEMLSARIAGANESTRVAIASVLGQIGREEDAMIVASLMKDESDAVRRAAVEALAHVSAVHDLETLKLALADESHRVRSAAGRALVRSGRTDLVGHLERLLQDDDSRVRAATLRAIGEIQPEMLSAEDQTNLIGTGLDDSGAVCMAAVEAMVAVGGVGAAARTLPLLSREEPEIVQAVVRCVGRHGEGEHLDQLLTLVAHTHWSVRAEAVQVLAERRHVRALPAILRCLETEQDSFVREAILHALSLLEA
ncbi:MAG: HEAT repeat domain-containing protein [Myxococcota bacterium]|nr:HEAT repeat domain-containing protein [Myxococcota bacterium]